MKPQQICFLVTGYMCIPPIDGGMLSFLALFEKLCQHGAAVSVLCLTNRDKTQWLCNPCIKIVSKTSQQVTFYYERYSFPFALYFTEFDLRNAYSKSDQRNLLVSVWHSILKDRKIDAVFTTSFDVISMTVSAAMPVLRYHLEAYDDIYHIEDPFYSLLKALLPQFKVLCISLFLARKLKERYQLEAVTVRPIMNLVRFRLNKKDRDCITLINNHPHKGLLIFLNLVTHFKARKFLLVAKPNSKPIENLDAYPNLEVLTWQEAVETVYKRTRILLFPSLCEEAFGRVAVEAQNLGIPVIANDVGGIREAMNGAGYLIPVNECFRSQPDFYSNSRYHFQTIGKYIQCIQLLDDAAVYETAVQKARASAADLKCVIE